MKTFPHEVINQAKKLFVEDNKGPKEISDRLGGNPHFNTIRAWSKKPDPDTGKTWEDERREYRKQKYAAASPANMAVKLYARINEILDSEDMDVVKMSDALSKLQKTLEKVTDPKNQVAVMFDMLTDMMLFFNNRHRHLVNDEFCEAIREFKNVLLQRLN